MKNFTLVEPLSKDILLDRPALSCAMLMGAVKKAGIPARLVTGKTKLLKFIFNEAGEELHEIIGNLKPKDFSELNIANYNQFQNDIISLSPTKFQKKLRKVYKHIITDKCIRTFLNVYEVSIFQEQYRNFLNIYNYCIDTLNMHDLKIIDFYVNEIKRTMPTYIGFSLYFNLSAKSLDPISRLIINRIKKELNIPVVLGGPSFSFCNKKQLTVILKDINFDYISVGPSEKTLVSLLTALNTKSDIHAIDNIFYKEGKVLKKNHFSVSQDMENLPYPDYTQFDLKEYILPDLVLPLQISRGCTWRKCAFCSHHRTYFNTYCYLKPETAADILEHLSKKYNCKHFAFHSEELTPDLASKISQAIIEKNIRDITIYTYARMEEKYNNNILLKNMKKAGFGIIHWGMESGCQKTLDNMNKGTDVKNIKEILKNSADNGLWNVLFLIFGFPGETEKDAKVSLKFLKNNSKYIHALFFSHFHVSPFSPIAMNPDKWGITINKNYEYTVNSGMTCKESAAFIKKTKIEMALKKANFTSSKIQLEYNENLLRMANLLYYSHEIIENKTVKKRCQNNDFTSIFPVIPGTISSKELNTIFHPINIGEALVTNFILPARSRNLDKAEKIIFELSNGQNSVDSIIDSLSNKMGYTRAKSQKKSIDFYLEIYSKNWAIAFGRPWS